ncbi:MAG: methyltransferase domain-containing protein [Methylobacter sp.]
MIANYSENQIEIAMWWITKKLKKGLIHKLLRKFGPTSIKQRIWDEEFKSGQWDFLVNTENDPIYHFLGKYCGRSGDILDLGCGSGNTGNELGVDKYHHYVGIDVSQEAIRKAQARSERCFRISKNFYNVSDIISYVPDKNYSVILFRESIFYIPLEKIEKTLRRLSKTLTNNGVFIIRMCDRMKYAKIVKLIDKRFEVKERYFPDGENSIILVFR